MQSRRTFQTVLGLGLVLGLASSAHAQATRTWVSGVGDDVNPCSRTAPCKTFAGAISKTATGGYISALDPGGFGAITINKSITLDGAGTGATILASGSNAINVVTTPNMKVTIRNLVLMSPSAGLQGVNGINVTAQNVELHVENVWIGNFTTNAINFNPTGGGEGYVYNVTLANNPGGGVVVNTGRVLVSNLHADSNGNGVIVTGNAIATVRDSYASGGGVGFGATLNAQAIINVENCTSTHNQFGIFAASGSLVRVSDSMIVSNTDKNLQRDASSQIVSMQGNEVAGAGVLPDGTFSSTVVKQ